MSGGEAQGAANAAVWDKTIRRVAGSRGETPGFSVVRFPELAAALGVTTDVELQQRILYGARRATFDGATLDEQQEYRARAIAACAWWWMDDLRLTPDEYRDLRDESLRLAPNKTVPPHRSRSTRHSWARRQYLIAAKGDSAPRPLSGDVSSGKVASGANGEYQEALIALLHSMLDGSETVPASSTSDWASGAAGDSAPPRKSEEEEDGTVATPAERDRAARATARWRRPAAIGVVGVVLAVIFASATLPQVGTDQPLAGPPSQPLEDETDRITEARWGPMRDTISALSRNSVVALNSMIDSPVYGDERNFVRVSRADQTYANAVDEIAVTPGEAYTAYVYFSNDADPAETRATAEGTRLRVQAPKVIYGSGAVHAFVSASNATPPTVWDGATLLLSEPQSTALIRSVPNSSSVRFNGNDKEIAVDINDLVSTDGALIGCPDLDGTLPPGDQCAGFLSFQFVIDKPDFSVGVGARVKGTDASFSSAVLVSEGDVLEFRGEYLNTGTTVQNDVVLKSASLPDGLRYVRESARVSNEASGFQYASTKADPTVPEGINLGNYAPGGGVYVKYDVIAQDLEADGVRWMQLRRAMSFETNNGTKSADLDLTIIR